MVLIAVHGSASRLLPAERGTVRLTLELTHDDRATVMRQVGALHERFVAEAEALVAAGTATRWGSSRVWARSERRYDAAGDTARVVQVASATVEVRFQDFEALSSWLLAAGSVEGVAVDGIEWAITRDHRVQIERELRVEAVRDAVQRAEAYASAVGGSSVVLQAVWEEGLRHPGAGPAAKWVAQGRAESMGAAMQLRPDDIEIGASVTADFSVAAAATA